MKSQDKSKELDTLKLREMQQNTEDAIYLLQRVWMDSVWGSEIEEYINKALANCHKAKGLIEAQIVRYNKREYNNEY